MTNLQVVAAVDRSRAWEAELLTRLSVAGHVVSVHHESAGRSKEPSWLDRVLALEERRFGPSLLSYGPPLPARAAGKRAAELVLDLTGTATSDVAPLLQLRFNGQSSLVQGLAAMLPRGAMAELSICLNGTDVGRGKPMIGDRVWLSRFGDDVLAGAIALVEQTLARFEAGTLRPLNDGEAGQPAEAPGFLRHYLPFVTRGLGERLVQKVFHGRRPFYWQVAYRLIDGPGVADTGALDGPAFAVLPDDGARFYADPFPFEHDGRHFLFVEEFPYATGKGVIAVAELDADGTFDRPRIVLEEPHHLSYPQILRQGNEIYMLPESSAANELVLYRSLRFPDKWVRDTVLIDNRNINDATVLEAHGKIWLFATERSGYGSASDKMVVYHALDLRGPWKAHRLNPIAIDRAAARPGGHFIRQGKLLMLPVQDGSSTYGGGLGIMTLERLDADAVVFSKPRSVGQGPAWQRVGIHTLNRAGPLEVVDSAG